VGFLSTVYNGMAWLFANASKLGNVVSEFKSGIVALIKGGVACST